MPQSQNIESFKYCFLTSCILTGVHPIRNGETLRLLFEFFSRKEERAYQKLVEMIKQKLSAACGTLRNFVVCPSGLLTGGYAATPKFRLVTHISPECYRTHTKK